MDQPSIRATMLTTLLVADSAVRFGVYVKRWPCFASGSHFAFFPRHNRVEYPIADHHKAKGILKRDKGE